MSHWRIVVPADGEGEAVGAQIKAILDADTHYQVTVVDFDEPIEAIPELIVPILPSSFEKARNVLAGLRRHSGGVALLPVVQSAALHRLESLCLRDVDFLLIPLRETELRMRVRRILGSVSPTAEIQERTRPAGTELVQLVGEARVFMDVKNRIPKMAQSERTVLIVGETGTGKELCARALHYLSPRADKPFIPLNCGAIPIDLFERELFGHQKGAFTSAWNAQAGFLAEAESGTLFLDEIEALPLAAQVKLLRFLQDRSYSVLGSPKLKKSDVRIIASTNVDLTRRVYDGLFREDLFYRLAVLVLNLPPLRERSGDVPLLARHFWNACAETDARPSRELSPSTVEALKCYSWPGNVRELENVIHRIVVLGEDEMIEPRDLPVPLPLSQSATASLKEAKAKAIEQFERSYIAGLLQKHNGNVTQAAREAKKDRRAMGRLIKKYRVSKAGPLLSRAWDKA